jgi:hypothetical protein
MERNTNVLWEGQRFGFCYFVILVVEHDATVELQLHQTPYLEPFGFVIRCAAVSVNDATVELQLHQTPYLEPFGFVIRCAAVSVNDIDSMVF